MVAKGNNRDNEADSNKDNGTSSGMETVCRIPECRN
jgi:hypothetical protein